MYDDDFAAAVAMRMSVFFRGTPVRGPAGVADAIAAVQRFEADGFFQVAQLAFRTAHLQLVPVAGNGDSGRVVAAVLQTTQTFNDDGNDFLLADVTDDATHAGNSRNFNPRGSSEILQ